MERIIDQRQIGILLAAINGSLATFKERYDQGKYSPDTLLSLLGGVQALRDAMEGELPQPTLVHVELLINDTELLYRHLETYKHEVKVPLALQEDDEESDFDKEDAHGEK